MDYLKIWINFAEVLEPLNDAERGRLLTAMLAYASSGQVPELRGSERYVWPQVKQDIDRQEAYARAHAENGRKGGRPKSEKKQTKANESEEKQTEAEESSISHSNGNGNEVLDISPVSPVSPEQIEEDDHSSSPRAREAAEEIRIQSTETRREAAARALRRNYGSGYPRVWEAQLEMLAEESDLPPRLIEAAVDIAAGGGAASPVAYAAAVMQDMAAKGVKSRAQYAVARLREGGG